MKITLIAIVLLIIPVFCFAEKEPTEINKDIVEAVLRYEFQHIQQYFENFRTRNKYAEYKATHFTIEYTEPAGFTADRKFISRFSDIYPPVINKSELTSNYYESLNQYKFYDSNGNRVYPIRIDIEKFNLLKDGTAKVQTFIILDNKYGTFYIGRFIVSNKNGKWIPTLTKRGAGSGD